MQRHLRYGELRIAYTVRFMPNSRQRICIHVTPEGGVQVDAPEDAAPEKIAEAVQRRARWIWQQLDAQSEQRRHVLPREYVSGESHLYLGKHHVLKVIRSQNVPSVKLLRGKIEIVTPSTDAGSVQCLLDAWYRHRAEDIFVRRIAEIAPQLTWLRVVPALRLRNMRTQWGSCSPAGVLVLNPQLVKAPRVCIDYVIVHELCHLKEHNHSARYYRLLQSALPDWKERKQRLDGMAEMILNR